MKNKFRRSIGTNILIYFCAAVLFILILFPFYWIICTSFKETLDIYVIPPEFFPKKFDFTNYALAFTKYKVPVFFINSLKVTVATVFFTTHIGSLAAFSLTRMHFLGSKTLRKFLGITQMFPVVVLLVPLFIMCSKLKMYNKLPSLILPYVALQLPVSIILQSGYYKDVPLALEEAATIDGCSSWQTFWRIVFPMLKPTIATVAIIDAMAFWNDYLLPSLVLGRKELYTLPIATQVFYGTFSTDIGLIMAALLLAMLPILILYLFLQRYIVEGVTAGAVK